MELAIVVAVILCCCDCRRRHDSRYHCEDLVLDVTGVHSAMLHSLHSYRPLSHFFLDNHHLLPVLEVVVGELEREAVARHLDVYMERIPSCEVEEVRVLCAI